jgi:hypothetical protein
MGYFSRLVEWHLEYPPTEEEKQRNDKVCSLYQGNRNPFVDFPEDSWSLLNFHAVEGEKCPDEPLPQEAEDNQQGQEQQQEDVEDEDQGRVDIQTEQPIIPPSMIVVDPFCHSLLAGDINFFMVEPANADNGLADSFGLITLIDLPSNVEIFVTDNAWMGNKGFQSTEGTWKVRF